MLPRSSPGWVTSHRLETLVARGTPNQGYAPGGPLYARTWTVTSLLRGLPAQLPLIRPRVLYAALCSQFASGLHHRSAATVVRTFTNLRTFTRALELHVWHHPLLSRSVSSDPPLIVRDRGGGEGYGRLGLDWSQLSARDAVALTGLAHLLARCHTTLAEWHLDLHRAIGRGLHVDGILDSLDLYVQAIQYDPGWHHSWHSWAGLHYRVSDTLLLRNHLYLREAVASESPPPEAGGGGTPLRRLPFVDRHVVPAIQGFFFVMSLHSTGALQDTLRVLALWFSHGQFSQVRATIRQGFVRVRTSLWLQVFPQLIAHLDAPNPNVLLLLQDVLNVLSQSHPQSLLYPLLVVSRSRRPRRRRAALQLLALIQSRTGTLVDQAQLVSAELIRVSALWPELWRRALDHAWRSRSADPKIHLAAIDRHLGPLFRKLTAPETPHETALALQYLPTFRRAQSYLKQCQSRPPPATATTATGPITATPKERIDAAGCFPETALGVPLERLPPVYLPCQDDAGPDPTPVRVAAPLQGAESGPNDTWLARPARHPTCARGPCGHAVLDSPCCPYGPMDRTGRCRQRWAASQHAGPAIGRCRGRPAVLACTGRSLIGAFGTRFGRGALPVAGHQGPAHTPIHASLGL